MATTASLDKRISNLESAGETEDKLVLIFVHYEGGDPNTEGTRPIYHKCVKLYGEDAVNGTLVSLSKTGDKSPVYVSEWLMNQVVEELSNREISQ